MLRPSLWRIAALAMWMACGFAAPARARERLDGRARAVAEAGLRDRAAADPVPLLFEVPPGADPRAWGLLSLAPGIGAIRLPTARARAFMAAHPELIPSLAPRLRPTLDVAGEWIGATAVHSELGLSGKGVVVGVIDTAFDVGHPAFVDAEGNSRIAWMLTLGAPRGLHPELEERFGCNDPQQAPCSVLSAADIAALLDAGAPPGDLRDVTGHGTHVASIAAGNGGLSLPSGPVYVGVAPEATLVLAEYRADGFADVVLRGARFVFDRAEALAQPAVVNLSAGTHRGPHDGSSALGKGLAALAAEGPGRAVVVSAGNDGGFVEQAGEIFGVHATQPLAPDASCRIEIASILGEGRVEVWMTFDGAEDVRVGLESPSGERWLEPAAPGEPLSFEAAGVQGTLVGIETPEGAARGLTSAVLTWEGRWQPGRLALGVSGLGGVVDLWVSGRGESLPSPHYFVSPARSTTVGIPASHPDLIAVGATMNRTTWPTMDGMPAANQPAADGIWPASSAGPGLAVALKPDITAPGFNVVAARSEQAEIGIVAGYNAPCEPSFAPCALVDDHFAVSGGTSMAAPMAAGAAALLLEADPSLGHRDIKLALMAGARRVSAGHGFHGQRGAGTLDLEGALAALAGEVGGAVSAAESFWTLSSAYARPGSLPLAAVIQLRDASGNLAGDIDPDRIDVALVGASLVEAPSQLAAATFSFAVRPDPGAELVSVEVGYAGERIGEPARLETRASAGMCTTLEADEGEGCSCRAAGAAHPRSLGWAVVACLLAAARLRNSRCRSAPC